MQVISAVAYHESQLSSPNLEKSYICPLPKVPFPDGHGRKIAEGETILKWLNSKPAPEKILEFVSCSCKKSCLNEDSCCF